MFSAASENGPSSLDYAAPPVPDAPVERQPSRFPAPFAAALVAAVSVTVLVGWAVDSPVLKCVIPGMTSMKVNTALELLFLAIGLQGVYAGGGPWRWAGRAALGAMFLLCLLTAAEYALHVDLRIDNALFVDRVSSRYPGRNAPATITCFTMVGVALMLLDGRRASTVAQSLLLLTTAVPLATLGGYLYRAPGMYASVAYPVVALNTAVALTLLCVGGLWLRPREGLMRVATSRTGAGSLARLLLPLAIAVPLGAGVATLAGQRLGLYGGEFGSALLVTGSVIFFGGAVLWAASRLYATEGERDALLVREQAARSRAESAVLARDQLLAVVSHELRTPLTPIMLLVTALTERKDLPPDVMEDLQVIREQAQAEMVVVSDLLDLVGLRQGQLRLVPKVADLRELVRAAAAAAAAHLAEHKLDFTVQLLATRATHVRGDQVRLLQVLRNLLDNAAKFTPPGGRVTIRCVDWETASAGATTSPTGGPTGVIEVEDSGVGIDPSAAERVFDAFEQADRSITRKFGGLGLGLTISRMIVALHGGTLTLYSAGAGQGATFRICLPTVAAPEPVETPAKPFVSPVVPPPTFVPIEPASAEPAGPALRRVLLVEDHADTRNSLARLLRAYGYEVTTAGTAGEAVELALHHPFDVVVSDIGLPDVSGWEMMRRLRERRGDESAPLRGIALSGFTADEDRKQSLEAGYLSHLAKPIEVTDLIKEIERVGSEVTA